MHYDERRSRHKHSWCTRHQDRTASISIACPRCRHGTHVHESHATQARRGQKVQLDCLRCKRPFLLLVQAGRAGLRLMPVEQGEIVMQLTLDGKAPRR